MFEFGGEVAGGGAGKGETYRPIVSSRRLNDIWDLMHMGTTQRIARSPWFWATVATIDTCDRLRAFLGRLTFPSHPVDLSAFR
jgi:hypothetical protein